MDKRRKMNTSVLTLFFFAFLGLVFFVMWARELGPDRDPKGRPEPRVARTQGPLYPLDPLVIELSGRYLDVIHEADEKAPRLTTRKRFLEIALDLELKDKEAVTRLKKQVDQVRAAIIAAVSPKRVSDIETIEGKAALMEDMMNRLNALFPEDPVAGVHYRGFIIR